MAQMNKLIAANKTSYSNHREEALFHSLESAFLPIMDQIVSEYEKHSEERLALLQKIEISLFLISCFILYLEWQFIFRPSLAIFQKQEEERGSAYSSLKESYNKILSSKKELRQYLEELKNKQEILEKRQEQYRLIVENATDIVYELNPVDGTFQWVNPKMEELSGYPFNELRKMPYWDIVREDFRNSIRDFYSNQTKNKEENSYYEFPMITKSGEVRWMGRNVKFYFSGQWVFRVDAIARDITSIKKTEADLVQAKQYAEKAALSKDNFLSAISHELRTPLNAVVGITNILKEEKLNNRQQELLKGLDFSSRNLLALINDILDFQKIQENKLQLELHPFNLNDLFKDLHSLWKYKAENNGRAYHVDDIIVKRHSPKYIIFLIHLIFGMFSRDNEFGVMSQIKGKQASSHYAVDYIIVGQEICG
jgi:PAS domain S-box-containing protein